MQSEGFLAEGHIPHLQMVRVWSKVDWYTSIHMFGDRIGIAL